MLSTFLFRYKNMRKYVLGSYAKSGGFILSLKKKRGGWVHYLILVTMIIIFL